jgi:hypothetical protein
MSKLFPEEKPGPFDHLPKKDAEHGVHTSCPTCYHAFIENNFCPHCGPIGHIPVVKAGLPLMRRTLPSEAASALPVNEYTDPAHGDLLSALKWRRRFQRRAALLIAVVLLGGGGWWAWHKLDWLSPSPVVMKLPSTLVDPPSKARESFSYWMRDLRDLAEEAPAELIVRVNPDPVVASGFMTRLDRVVDRSRDFEPDLSPEERKVFNTVKHGIGQLREFLRSFKERVPDLGATYAKAASTQFNEALHLLAPDLGRRGQPNAQFPSLPGGAPAKLPSPGP